MERLFRNLYGSTLKEALLAGISCWFLSFLTLFLIIWFSQGFDLLEAIREVSGEDVPIFLYSLPYILSLIIGFYLGIRGFKKGSTKSLLIMPPLVGCIFPLSSIILTVLVVVTFGIMGPETPKIAGEVVRVVFSLPFFVPLPVGSVETIKIGIAGFALAPFCIFFSLIISYFYKKYRVLK